MQCFPLTHCFSLVTDLSTRGIAVGQTEINARTDWPRRTRQTGELPARLAGSRMRRSKDWEWIKERVGKDCRGVGGEDRQAEKE
ncbi:hypothetical protein RRG08_011484 [Elysia crispata]|uniref:Uncharacterized protein n=1 Tax=Elysia crispata TaxID=231223 RepID=A0AAE1B8N8_9GAST|nr:hypothetical protein RRG08_011484 [Elysia crispata]